jgi:hypothetical protein
MRYRRAKVPGATYFFTVNLANRSSRLLTDETDNLREAVRKIHRAHPFQIVAWCVLPEHRVPRRTVGWGDEGAPTHCGTKPTAHVGVRTSPQPTNGGL